MTANVSRFRPAYASPPEMGPQGWQEVNEPCQRVPWPHSAHAECEKIRMSTIFLPDISRSALARNMDVIYINVL